MIIRSKHICMQDRIVDGCLEIHDGKITCITESELPGAEDFTEQWVIPGIFDTHNHSCQGYNIYGKDDDERVSNTNAYLKSLARHGVTLVFPTLFTTVADQESLDVIKTAARFVGQDVDGAKSAGIHFEGPFLNRVGEKGQRYTPDPIDLKYVETCLRLSNGTIKLMGHAPELSGSKEMIQLLLEQNVTAAFTHSDANSKVAFCAFDNGVTVSTHTCNVMVGINHREIGGLGASLMDDRVWCELICDGLHVCNDMLKLILRIKPHDHIMLISDSSLFVGLPTGRYHVDDGIITLDEEGRVLDENGKLDGSSKPLLYGIHNLVKNAGISLLDALRMSSLNPCIKYGFADRKGSLQEGKDADFVILDSDFQVIRTYSEGRKIYELGKDDELFNPAFMEQMEK